MPKVSVIIPTYNRAKLIRRAVDSVLSQSYKDYEIIIVDDGSTDNTKEILANYDGSIRYIYKNNEGISATRNRGIKEAKGEFIAFLDSDDEWLPDKLALQADLLEKNKKLGLVCSKMIILNGNSEKIGMKPEQKTGEDFRELLEIGGDLPTSTVMVRKECFDKVGVFDELLPPMEDFEMWVRIASKYDIYTVPDKIFALYYRHDQQITSDKFKVYEATVKLQRKFMTLFKHMPDFPAKAVQNKLASYAYVLSRMYYKEGRFKDAFSALCESIINCPIIGTQFFEKNDSITKKIAKFIKPYVYFPVCFMHKILSRVKNI